MSYTEKLKKADCQFSYSYIILNQKILLTKYRLENILIKK
jgi:hypothetical protein